MSAERFHRKRDAVAAAAVVTKPTAIAPPKTIQSNALPGRRTSSMSSSVNRKSRGDQQRYTRTVKDSLSAPQINSHGSRRSSIIRTTSISSNTSSTRSVSHRSAQDAFHDFGGEQASHVVYKTRQKTIVETPRMVKKYVPGPRGLVAVEVPAETNQRSSSIKRSTSLSLGSRNNSLQRPPHSSQLRSNRRSNSLLAIKEETARKSLTSNGSPLAMKKQRLPAVTEAPKRTVAKKSPRAKESNGSNATTTTGYTRINTKNQQRNTQDKLTTNTSKQSRVALKEPKLEVVPATDSTEIASEFMPPSIPEEKEHLEPSSSKLVSIGKQSDTSGGATEDCKSTVSIESTHAIKTLQKSATQYFEANSSINGESEPNVSDSSKITKAEKENIKLTPDKLNAQLASEQTEAQSVPDDTEARSALENTDIESTIGNEPKPEEKLTEEAATYFSVNTDDKASDYQISGFMKSDNQNSNLDNTLPEQNDAVAVKSEINQDSYKSPEKQTHGNESEKGIETTLVSPNTTTETANKRDSIGNDHRTEKQRSNVSQDFESETELAQGSASNSHTSLDGNKPEADGEIKATDQTHGTLLSPDIIDDARKRISVAGSVSSNYSSIPSTTSQDESEMPDFSEIDRNESTSNQSITMATYLRSVNPYLTQKRSPDKNTPDEGQERALKQGNAEVSQFDELATFANEMNLENKDKDIIKPENTDTLEIPSIRLESTAQERKDVYITPTKTTNKTASIAYDQKPTTPIKSAMKKGNSNRRNFNVKTESAASDVYLSLATTENTRLNAQIASSEDLTKQRSPSPKSKKRNSTVVARPLQSQVRNTKNPQPSMAPPAANDIENKRKVSGGIALGGAAAAAAKSSKSSSHSKDLAKKDLQNKRLSVTAAAKQTKNYHDSKNLNGQRNAQKKFDSAVAKQIQTSGAVLYPKEPPAKKSSFEKTRPRKSSNSKEVKDKHENSKASTTSAFGFKNFSLRDAMGESNQNYSVSSQVPSNAYDSDQEEITPSGAFKSRFHDSDSENELQIPKKTNTKSNQNLIPPNPGFLNDSTAAPNAKESPMNVNKKFSKISLRSFSQIDQPAYKYDDEVLKEAEQQRIHSNPEHIPLPAAAIKIEEHKSIGTKLKKLFGRKRKN